MAALDRDRWRDLDPLLDHALELTGHDRDAWLDALHAHSPALAADLRALLAGETAADRRGFLAAPFAAAERASAPAVGMRVGGYTIERAIGRGGMGSVWLARRVDGRFEGRVAVKFLHRSLLDGGGGSERFRREGSMLARLAHPGIARLLDAGVAGNGQPYLVLEYVEGQPIDAYAESRGLSVADRLRLALQVLAAVGHAHERLIVHRDLKPSNILVTDDGVAKLLDFGIAKLLDPGSGPGQVGGAGAALTQEGARALTPEYAAPEQLRGEMITTASDVYAVGVLVYALLTGRRPHELSGRTLGEIAYLVNEVDPPRPSDAVGAASPVRRRLRGDVDAIVMKALHREAARRYPTAAAFAEDIQRHLDGRPVRARPDSAAYRVRRFVARHRVGVAVAAATVGLVVGAGVRERALRERAEAEAAKARAVEEYLVSVFDVSDPFTGAGRGGADVTARALLDRGAMRVDSALADQPEAQADLRVALARVYCNLGLYDDAERMMRRALALRRRLHGPRHAAVAEAMDGLGQVLARRDRHGDAEPLLREALAQRRALLGDVRPETAESLDHLATLLQERGDLGAAEPLFREAVAVRRAVHGRDHAQVANALNNLALVFYLRARYDEAEPLYREALAIDARELGEEHLQTAQTLHNLAQVESARGRHAAADSLYRRALAVKRRLLGDLHPSVTVNLNNLGIMLAQDLGRLDEAEALIRDALALDRRMFGERHSYVAESVKNLATVRKLRGDFDGAERLYRETLAMNRSLFGPEHARVARSLANVAGVRAMRGDFAEAVPLYRQALGQYERLLGTRHPNHVGVSVSLARALRERGGPERADDLAEAERLLRAALRVADTAGAVPRWLAVSGWVALGETLVDGGRAAEARPLLERALSLARAQLGDGDWRTGEARLALGRALADGGGGAGRAAAMLREAVATLARHRHAQPRLAARAAATLRGVERAAERGVEARARAGGRRGAGDSVVATRVGDARDALSGRSTSGPPHQESTPWPYPSPSPRRTPGT